MKKETVYKKGEIEVCVFPMECLSVTKQGPGFNSDGTPILDPNLTTHCNSWAVDLNGYDGGMDYAYAPVTVRCIKKYTTPYSASHTCVFSSVNKVLLPNDEVDYIDFIMEHDFDISRLQEGEEYPQGSLIYQEGDYGNSYGNHIHIEARQRGNNKAPTKIDPQMQDCYDDETFLTWSLVNNQPLQDIFFLNDTYVKNDIPKIKNVSDWKIFEDNSFDPTGKANGWYNYDGDTYYVKNEKLVTGWQKLTMTGGSATIYDFYFRDNGKLVKNDWIEYPEESSSWYHVDTYGKMQTGWFFDTSGAYYFLNDGRYTDAPDGMMMRNKWVASGSTWYYVKEGGVMAQSESLSIGGKTYQFDASGKCLNP